MPIGLTRRTTCRLCDSRDLELVVPMAPTAIADAYVPRERKDDPQDVYPLDLYFCGGCGHVQLLDVVDPRLMFRPDYTFRSGGAKSIVDHFRDYTNMLLARENPPPGARVIDIGSNDGTFLRFFRDAGLSALGIDPASVLAREATAAGIETLPRFLTPDLARTIRSERGPARIVTANNVFAHIDDLGAVADSVRTMLADDGIFAFEVSYLVDVVDHMLLGTIFHEHLCYHTVRALRGFLARHDLELVHVERVPVQGGSIIGLAQPAGGPRSVAPAVTERIRDEEARGFQRAETYRAFGRRIDAMKEEVHEAIVRACPDNGTVAGFGAARSGTTILARLGLGGRLAFLVDDSPDKQGQYSPGDHLPILPTDALYERKPDLVILLAWVHAKAILAKHAEYARRGGRWLGIYPRVEVISA